MSEDHVPSKSESHEKFQHTAAFETEVAAAAPRLSGHKLTAAIAFVAGTGFTLFGYASMLTSSSAPGILTGPTRYDQGVMSALLTAKQVSSQMTKAAESRIHLLTRLFMRSSKMSSPKWSSLRTNLAVIMRPSKVLWSLSMFVPRGQRT